MLVAVEMRRQLCDFALSSGELSPREVVLVNDVRHRASYSSGLTELDALGAFREHTAFLNQISPSDVNLMIAGDSCRVF